MMVHTADAYAPVFKYLMDFTLYSYGQNKYQLQDSVHQRVIAATLQNRLINYFSNKF